MTINHQALHNAGHLVVGATLGVRPVAPTPDRLPGTPWYAASRLFPTRRNWPPAPAARAAILRNRTLRWPAILAMGGIAAEHQFTGRSLSDVLASAEADADLAWIKDATDAHTGEDYHQVVEDALATALGLLSLDRFDTLALARHPLASTKPWELGSLLTRADALPPWFQMTVHGMPFNVSIWPHGVRHITVDALLPDNDMGITFEAPRSSSSAKIIKQIVADITHYRLSLEHDYQRQLQAA